MTVRPTVESTPDVVPLSDLPLPDPSLPDPWDVASAALRWRTDRAASLDRDVAAQQRAELDAQLEEAYRRGLMDGRAAAEAEGLELVRSLHEGLAHAVERSDDLVRAQLLEAGSEMLAGSVAIARWAIGREVDLDPTVLLEVAASALAQSGGIGGSKVYVNPSLGRAATRWSARFGLDAPEVVEDPAVDAGCVVVKSAHEGTASVSVAELIERACETLDVQSVREVPE